MSSSTSDVDILPPHRPSSTPKIDNFQTNLTLMKQQGHTSTELLSWLKQHGVTASPRTLDRRLRKWGVRRKATAQIDDQLAERVNWLFHHTLLNDSQIANRIIEEDGLITSQNQVKEVRQLFGWRRNQNSDSTSSQQLTTQRHVQSLIQQGPGRTFGRRWAITYLRHHFGHKARQYDVTNAQKLFDPVGVASRLPGIRFSRLDNYITSGPNFLWCLDGHDKLTQYGFQIYAAVDAYSRKIIWSYCGNANRAQLSVLKQYLTAVKSQGFCPNFLRTDKGTETIMLADAHFSLYVEAALREQWSEEQYLAIRLTDCYIYGPSTRNIRIEGLWRQQRYTTTGTWISYFAYLKDADVYRQWERADRIILLFVFMPIIRQELVTFVNTHNAHPIRRQRNRVHHVAGVPNELYRRPSCGFAIDQGVVNEWENKVAGYGEWSRSVFH